MSDIHKMSLSSLLCQIDSIKDNSASFLPGEGKQDPDKKIWQDDVDACNAATEIIKKLCEENCFSVADAISYIAQSKKLLQDWGQPPRQVRGAVAAGQKGRRMALPGLQSQGEPAPLALPLVRYPTAGRCNQMRRKVTFLKIAPATAAAKDTRPVFATMPLRRIVPNPCNPEWKPATCPICGQDCWLQTGNAELVKQVYPGAKFVCSECAWTGKAAANQ